MRPPTLLVTGGERRGARALAAALATELGAAAEGQVLLAEPGAGAARPTLLAAPGARTLEARLRERGLEAAARGHFCRLGCEPNPAALGELGAAADAVAAGRLVLFVPGPLWWPALECDRLRIRGAVLLAHLPEERSLAALAATELRSRRLPMRVVRRAPAALAARRAQAGVRPGGATSARVGRLAARLLGEGQQGRSTS